ncbi:MAG: hypothetical protein AAFZ63_00800 [Bacteroidota bacterium]
MGSIFICSSWSSFRIEDDFNLAVSAIEPTNGIGPNSITYTSSAIDGRNGLVYVANIARLEFAGTGEPEQQGSIMGYWLQDDGNYLYQLHGLGGKIGIYRIEGDKLNFVDNVVGELPQTNVQGIVTI